MRTFILVLLIVVSGTFLSASAQSKTVRVQFQLLLPSTGWAVGAAAALEWPGGTDTDQSDRHGLVTFTVPSTVKVATLSATDGLYCLPDTSVAIAKSHPGSQPAYTMIVCP